jgi:hypothetical protein
VQWSLYHPLLALGLAVEHAADLFTSPYWPEAEKDWLRVFQWLFYLLVLLPACFGLAKRARWLAHARPESAALWAALLPVAGCLAAAFLTIGESRLRLPFDGFFILLAAYCYAAFPSSVSAASLPDHPEPNNPSACRPTR